MSVDAARAALSAEWMKKSLQMNRRSDDFCRVRALSRLGAVVLEPALE